jgi:hypothetical protein
MFRTGKNQLSVPLLAMTGLVLAPAAAHAQVAGDISVAQVLNTSPLWADAQSYHACNVVNVTTSPVAVSIELITSAGAVLISAAPTIAAGNSTEVSKFGGYSGFARCRVTLNDAPGTIRANLTVFHSLGGGYQTYATSEAR